MLDCAVFSGRVHSLEDKQQRPAILGVEYVLLLREPLSSALEELGRLAFVQLETSSVVGVEVLQFKALAFGYPERVNVLLDLVHNLFSRHAQSPFTESQSLVRR